MLAELDHTSAWSSLLLSVVQRWLTLVWVRSSGGCMVGLVLLHMLAGHHAAAHLMVTCQPASCLPCGRCVLG